MFPFDQFNLQENGAYSSGTVGTVDVDCDFCDFTYVSKYNEW